MYNTIVSTIKSTMNNFVTANDLKVKGISAVEPFAKKGLETVVKVRGKDKYVILTTEAFNRLRKYELLAAIEEAEKDIASGNFREETAEEHLKRITNA